MESVLDQAMARYLQGESLVDVMTELTVRPVELSVHLSRGDGIANDIDRWRKEERTALEQVLAIGLDYWQAYAAGFSLTSVAEACGLEPAEAADKLLVPYTELRSEDRHRLSGPACDS